MRLLQSCLAGLCCFTSLSTGRVFIPPAWNSLRADSIELLLRLLFPHLLPRYVRAGELSLSEMTIKRGSDSAFGEPYHLLDKCKKAFRRAEEVVGKAMPDELFCRSHGIFQQMNI